MDIATIIGLVAGLACFAFGIMGEHGPANFKLFYSHEAILIVFGGSIGAIFIAFPIEQVINAGKVFKNTLFSKRRDPYKLVGTLVSMAEKARREGLLALEEESAALDDQFMKTGLQLVVDGTEPELVRSILEIDLAFLEDRHASGKKVFDQLGAFAPSMGMCGTLIGLIVMLSNFNDPAAIGPGMSLALVTTFFGAFLANFIYIPLAAKLEARNKEEILFRQLIVEGILGIQHGENPKIVEQKLLSFLSPSLRRRFGAAQPQAAAAEA